MKTIILIGLGIVLLVTIASFFSIIEIVKSKRADRHLAAIRKAMARKSEWLLNTRNQVYASAFRRTKLNSNLNRFSSNSKTPVLKLTA